jgi:GNAT superfamily N-acetyltransferase
MEIELRSATLDDADLVADLETARKPDEPRDGVMLRYWWTHSPSAKSVVRWIGIGEGRAMVCYAAGHQPWDEGAVRYGWARSIVHPEAWTDERYREGVARGEEWLRSAGAEVSTAQARADFTDEVEQLEAMGYREVRRQRFWELDLAARRDQLLAGAEESRAAMRSHGITLGTLADNDDESTLHKIHELDLAATEDIPTTAPIYRPPFDEWLRMYFENPAVRKDRFWIARIADEVVGMSLIGYPPGRGVPSTEFTGTSPRHRGRGIARALKYETVAQAIELGATRLRTDNDSENAPILHINEEMGYAPMTPYIELHRAL